MRIAYICGTESWGGLEMNQGKNALWMQEAGHTVSVFGRRDSKLATFCAEHQLNFIPIPKHKKYYDFKAARALRKQLEALNIEHLILRDVRDMSVSVAAKFWGKTHFKVHYFMEMQLGVSKRNLLHTIRFRLLDTWSCPLNWLEKQVLEKTRMKSENIVVIPSGLDLRPFQKAPSQLEAREILGLPKDKLLIGLAGRFDLQKGQVLLLEAISHLNSHEIEVVFLGEPTLNEAADYVEHFYQIIQMNGLENRVHVRPFRKDIEVFYAAIDAFVMASKAETVGMVTMEAMACGTPVIGSDAGGTVELLQKGHLGYLFEPLNAESLANAIEHFRSNPLLFNPEELQKGIQQFDYKKVIKQVEKRLLAV